MESRCARCAMYDRRGAAERVITTRQDPARWAVKPASRAPSTFPRERLLARLERY